MSEKSRAILEAVAKGRTYEQLLAQDSACTYPDIFRAAAEALDELGSWQGAKPDKGYSLEEVRHEHPRAYEKWSADEDRQLTELFRGGKSVQEIAATLHRESGAIRSRLAKLGLLAPR